MQTAPRSLRLQSPAPCQVPSLLRGRGDRIDPVTLLKVPVGYSAARVCCLPWPTGAVPVTMVLLCARRAVGGLKVGGRQESPVAMSAGFSVTLSASDPGASFPPLSDLGQVTLHLCKMEVLTRAATRALLRDSM